jgi:hypothetical protein
VDLLQLAQHGARAADRDPQVVQRLRVGAAQRAVHVRLGGVGQQPEHDPSGLVGPRAGRELDAGLRHRAKCSSEAALRARRW